MSVTRKELKQQAREAMRAARPAPFWIGVLMLVITLALTLLQQSLSGELAAYRVMLEGALHGQIVYAEPVPKGGAIGWALELAMKVMSAVMTVGFVIYTLRVWRREKASAGNLFDGFAVFFRALWIRVLPAVFLFLWSLVYAIPAMAGSMLIGWKALVIALPLIIPAIMAAYAYRLAPYIMLDRPDLGCLQCVLMSRELMRGHKGELFVLELSFLGWALLCVIVPVGGILLMAWLNVYMNVTCAGFYEAVGAERVRPEPSPGPEPPAW